MDINQIITWPYRLRRGHSINPEAGACAMDAVNWLAHGAHGDRPVCACPIIGSYVIVGNDRMPDDERQRLLPYLSRIAGSRSPAHEEARTRVFVLAAARVFAVWALDAAGMTKEAAKLRNLPDDATYREISDAADGALGRAAAVGVWKGASGASLAWCAAREATRAARAARAAAEDYPVYPEAAATAARAAAVWDDYFTALDAALAAGPQGEPWSADVVEHGAALYRAKGGLLVA